MKIVHVSSWDIAGGAARAAYRLHCGLRQIGEDSAMFVRERRSDDPQVIAYKHPAHLGLIDRLRWKIRHESLERNKRRYLTNRPDGADPFSDCRSKQITGMVEQLPPADIVHLHWIANFVDYETFFHQIGQNRPLVWTLHDMNPFTGGCHYNQDCRRFLRSCGNCPQLPHSSRRDLSRQIWRRKQRSYRAVSPSQVRIVAPSRWLATEARQSSLLGQFPVSVIPYGLDTGTFCPHDKPQSRARWNLPLDTTVLLFVADSVASRRKGFALLLEAIRLLQSIPNLLLVSIGRESPANLPAHQHRHLGAMADDQALAQIYSAADLFVIPSLQDNLPNTVLESLACGTPVVGFAAGGIPDVVRPGITGELAPVGNVAALADVIQSLFLEGAKRKTLAENCRRIAIAEFSLEVQAKQYMALYQELLKEPAA